MWGGVREGERVGEKEGVREGERVDEREGVREGEREKVGDRRGIGAVTMAAPISKKRKVRRHIHRNAEGKKERKRNETSKERNHVGCERVLRKKREWKRNKERNGKKKKIQGGGAPTKPIRCNHCNCHARIKTHVVQGGRRKHRRDGDDTDETGPTNCAIDATRKKNVGFCVKHVKTRWSCVRAMEIVFCQHVRHRDECSSWPMASSTPSSTKCSRGNWRKMDTPAWKCE